MTQETEVKNNSELNFWHGRLHSQGGPEYWRNIYFQLYCHYLNVNQYSFENKILFDIGCGPHGAIGKFKANRIFGIDPLAKRYHESFNLADHNVIYLSCGAENVPMLDGVADVIISRNAIDHTDNIERTMDEMHRLLRKDGEIRLSINYQEEATICEPNVINDEELSRILDGRFSYEIIQRFPSYYDSEIGGVGQFKYPHQIVLVRGIKI